MLARRLVLAALLATTGLVACSPSTELKRVRTPREGITLAYALEPGQGFEGQLRVGNTRPIDGLEKPLSQTATCDVTMVVLGPTAGGTEVRATITSVDLDWDLPPTATYSSQELLELAHARLRGMHVSFVVRPDGRIQALPEAPADAPPELAEVIDTLLFGIDAFFVPLPPEPLGHRDRWQQSFSHETASGLRMELDHELQLAGLYDHRNEDLRLSRLSIEQERREQRHGDEGPVTVERSVRSQLMFASSGFPLELDRETQEFDPSEGMVFRKVRAQWTRARGMAPELIAPAAMDVQVIADPCNPDYVGPEGCDEDDDPVDPQKVNEDADPPDGDEDTTEGTDPPDLGTVDEDPPDAPDAPEKTPDRG